MFEVLTTARPLPLRFLTSMLLCWFFVDREPSLYSPDENPQPGISRKTIKHCGATSARSARIIWCSVLKKLTLPTRSISAILLRGIRISSRKHTVMMIFGFIESNDFKCWNRDIKEEMVATKNKADLIVVIIMGDYDLCLSDQGSYAIFTREPEKGSRRC